MDDLSEKNASFDFEEGEEADKIEVGVVDISLKLKEASETVLRSKQVKDSPSALALNKNTNSNNSRINRRGTL